MVNNIANMVKATSSSKSSQTQKSKKSSSGDQSAFGQALTDAAGAANSANVQTERQTYDQKDTQTAEKSTESIQAVSENPVQQVALITEGMEGQDTLMNLVQMNVEGIQTGSAVEEAVTDQDVTGIVQETMQTAVQDTGVMQTSDAMQETVDTGKITLDTLPNTVSADETVVYPEEFAAETTVVSGQDDSQMPEQMMSSSDTGKETVLSESTRDDESGIIDVKAEAAADKAGTSFIQLQSSNDSGVVEAPVEVTGTGEIKPEYENMLKDMIAKQIIGGRQEFEIALTPKNLGTLLVKVAVEAGETTVSIICSNARTMQAMSSKASELGRMLETTLGDKMDVVVEDKNGQESRYYDEGHNDSGAQAQKEEQERRHEDARRKLSQEADSADFLQQLRLGLA